MFVLILGVLLLIGGLVYCIILANNEQPLKRSIIIMGVGLVLGIVGVPLAINSITNEAFKMLDEPQLATKELVGTKTPKMKNKSKYKTIDYEELLNDPSKYKGKKVMYTGKVEQNSIRDGEIHNIIRLETKSNDDYGDKLFNKEYMSSDTGEFLVQYNSKKTSDEFERNQTVRVYGVFEGFEEFNTQVGVGRVLPFINASKIEIIE